MRHRPQTAQTAAGAPRVGAQDGDRHCDREHHRRDGDPRVVGEQTDHRQQPEPDERGAARPRDTRAAVRGEAPEPVLDDEGARDADEEEQADARAAEARLPSALEQADDLVGAVVVYPLEEAGEVGALITRSREVDVAEREDGRGAGRAPCDDVADADAVSREHHDRHPERGDHGEDAAHVAAEHRETLDQDAGYEDRDRDLQAHAGPVCPRRR